MSNVNENKFLFQQIFYCFQFVPDTFSYALPDPRTQTRDAPGFKVCEKDLFE